MTQIEWKLYFSEIRYLKEPAILGNTIFIKSDHD